MKAEPRPTKDVTRKGGTATANGRWFRRFVRPLLESIAFYVLAPAVIIFVGVVNIFIFTFFFALDLLDAVKRSNDES